MFEKVHTRKNKLCIIFGFLILLGAACSSSSNNSSEEDGSVTGSTVSARTEVVFIDAGSNAEILFPETGAEIIVPAGTVDGGTGEVSQYTNPDYPDLLSNGATRVKILDTNNNIVDKTTLTSPITTTITLPTNPSDTSNIVMIITISPDDADPQTFYIANEDLTITTDPVRVTVDVFETDFAVAVADASQIGTLDNYFDFVAANSTLTAVTAANLAATEGAVVNLDGSSSTGPQGATLAYTWTQTSGLQVDLSDADTATPSFTAPNILADRSATFQLVVTANGVSSDPTSVTVNMSDTDVPGYHSRACGFDMNRDGVTGEEADCRVCDGVTTDPDGDGVAEDLIYVDSLTGSNGGDGSPGSPYQTLQYALDQADGNGSNEEDIICLYGTFTATAAPVGVVTQGGVVETYPRESFTFPRNPAMIVGWDKDQDGEYPPYDTDDLAVIDGTGSNGVGVNFQTNAVSYFEMAHLSITNFTGTDIVEIDNGSNDYFHLHDIAFSNINAGLTNSSQSVIHNRGDHFVAINLVASDVCCRFITNSFSSNTRMDHSTVILNGDNSALAIYNGTATLSAYRENNFDAGREVWAPAATSIGLHSNIGSNNMTFFKNRVRNFAQLSQFSVFNTSGIAADNIVIDSNEFVVDHTGVVGAHNLIAGGHAGPNDYVGDVTFVNNLIYATNGATLGECLRMNGGSDAANHSSITTFVGNSCINADRGIYSRDQTTYTFKKDNVDVRNNLFAGITGENIYIEAHDPSNFTDNGNVFTNGSNLFYWNGSVEDGLANWRGNVNTNSGLANDECTPTFLGSSPYVLDPTDTCARGTGVDISDVTTVDFEGNTRSGPSVAGAITR